MEPTKITGEVLMVVMPASNWVERKTTGTRTAPVSYTHLDVDKRQVMSSGLVMDRQQRKGRALHMERQAGGDLVAADRKPADIQGRAGLGLSLIHISVADKA